MDDCKIFTNNVLRNWKIQKVKNPKTNRNIKFWTNTFNSIEQQCNVYNDCKSIKGMKNIEAFSCYLDSALFLLLVIPNKHIDKSILFKNLNIHNINMVCSKKDSEKNLEAIINIQNELQKISFSIRNGKWIANHTCGNLLKIIKDQCKDSSYPKFFISTQRAPNDFIQFLFDIFNVDKYFKYSIAVKNIYKKKHYLKNINSSQFTYKNASPVWHVPNEVLQPNTKIRKYLKIKEINHYDKEEPLFLEADVLKQEPILYKKTTRSFEKLPKFLIFEISRVQLVSGIFNESRIIPDKNIKNLQLYGIIVHVGYTEPSDPLDFMMGNVGSGHYIAYFKCKGNWYEYDDLDSKINHIGTYQHLIDDTNVCTHGTMYFYST